MHGRLIHVRLQKPTGRQAHVELEIGVRTSGRLLDERHHVGICREKLLQLRLFVRRHGTVSVALLRIKRQQFFLDRIEVLANAAKACVGILFGRNLRVLQVSELNRQSFRPQLSQMPLKRRSGAPD